MEEKVGFTNKESKKVLLFKKLMWNEIAVNVGLYNKKRNVLLIN